MPSNCVYTLLYLIMLWCQITNPSPPLSTYLPLSTSHLLIPPLTSSHSPLLNCLPLHPLFIIITGVKIIKSLSLSIAIDLMYWKNPPLCYASPYFVRVTGLLVEIDPQTAFNAVVMCDRTKHVVVRVCVCVMSLSFSPMIPICLLCPSCS